MNFSEDNRIKRRDKKRYAEKYAPVRLGGIKGYSKYAWFQRHREKRGDKLE